jgi:phosphoribosylglycinamide formyltransferase-1
MYGMNVHKAVIDAKEMESGITIHHVNQKYDDGEIIAQYKCVINKGDTPETLSEKIRPLEHQHYPRVIEGLL